MTSRFKLKIVFEDGNIFINNRLIIEECYNIYPSNYLGIGIYAKNPTFRYGHITLPYGDIRKYMVWCAKKIDITDHSIICSFSESNYFVYYEHDFPALFKYMKMKRVLNWSCDMNDKKYGKRNYILKQLIKRCEL